MLRKAISVVLFLAATGGMLSIADPADAADDKAKTQKKDQKKKKAAAKKKIEPLKTDDIFKKLDANNDGKLDVEEFKKIFSVQAAPKGKKGKEDPVFDLEFTFKSLDANGDKLLSMDEFKGIVPAIYPPPKK
jgi:hypothetical protein